MLLIVLVLILGLNTSLPKTYHNNPNHLLEVYASIPDNVYESISLKLGDKADNEQIARYYIEHKDLYDNLNYNSIEF